MITVMHIYEGLLIRIITYHIELCFGVMYETTYYIVMTRYKLFHIRIWIMVPEAGNIQRTSEIRNNQLNLKLDDCETEIVSE